MWTPDYYVYPVDFPTRVEGIVTPNSDGTFSIYINRNLSEAKQLETLQHEIRHILKDHFYEEQKALRDKEREADGLAPLPDNAPPPDYPENWLFDPWGMPLGRKSPHAPDEKVIPLYSSPNAILKLWKQCNMMDTILSWTKLKEVGKK